MSEEVNGNEEVSQNTEDASLLSGDTSSQQGEQSEGQGNEGQKEEQKPEGAPESYEEFSMPDGVELDQGLMESFLPVAKDLNLTQEQAQKLIDLQTKSVVESAKAQQERWAELRKEWTDLSTSDEEFGGSSFKENLGLAKRVLDKYGTPELREALDVTGVGNHPELIRIFVRFGRAISEDKLDMGGKAKSTDQTPLANRLFPNQN